MTIARRTMTTAEELFVLPDTPERIELIRGELVREPPPGEEHGYIEVNLAGPLHVHVVREKLGRVLAGETGFLVERDPDTVLAPDVAFIASARLATPRDVRKYVPSAPDLAVEIISPSDRWSAVHAKVRRWLEVGARLVVVLDPEQRTAHSWSDPHEAVLTRAPNALTFGDVVPGFSISLDEVFGPPRLTSP